MLNVDFSYCIKQMSNMCVHGYFWFIRIWLEMKMTFVDLRLIFSRLTPPFDETSKDRISVTTSFLILSLSSDCILDDFVLSFSEKIGPFWHSSSIMLQKSCVLKKQFSIQIKMQTQMVMLHINEVKNLQVFLGREFYWRRCQKIHEKESFIISPLVLT